MTGLARGLIVFGAVLLFMGMAGHACAQTFDLTWTGAYGPGSATLTATNDGRGVYTITAISGIKNGQAIDGWSRDGWLRDGWLRDGWSRDGWSRYRDTDQAIYPFSRTNLVDFSGLAFSVGTYGGYPKVYTECRNGLPGTTLDITPAATTPEPASFLLFLTGLLAITFLTQRKLAR
jgi:hypothetical protein